MDRRLHSEAGVGFQPTGITLYAVPTQLVFVTEPSSTADAGVAFATQPVVEAEDASGNLGINFDATTVPGAQAVMTLSPWSGTGTLAGTMSVSPSGGFASFTGLDITGGGTFALTASASGFGSLNLTGTSSQTTLPWTVPTIYIVESTAGDGSGTGTSGTLAYVISQANANINPYGSEIVFGPSVFSGASPQTITVTASLVLSETAGPEVIDGPGADVLTISGGNSVGVFTISSGVTATISGLTISSGSTADSGGGLLNDGTLTLTDCTFSGNTAGNNGGGIANYGSAYLADCTIASNSATGTSGLLSGIGGGVGNWGTVTLTDCTIIGNSASGAGGGGVGTLGAATLTGCTISGNSSSGVGGGVAGGAGGTLA